MHYKVGFFLFVSFLQNAPVRLLLSFIILLHFCTSTGKRTGNVLTGNTQLVKLIFPYIIFLYCLLANSQITYMTYT